MKFFKIQKGTPVQFCFLTDPPGIPLLQDMFVSATDPATASHLLGTERIKEISAEEYDRGRATMGVGR